MSAQPGQPQVANCQIAVSVHAGTDTASGVLDWRLFVPESWDEMCVPDEDGNVENPHARRLRQSGWGLRPPVLIADAGYGQVAEFCQGLSERAISYVVATTSSSTVQPAGGVPVAPEYAGMGGTRSRNTPTRPGV